MSRNTAAARSGLDRATLYDDITNKIIAELEAGRVPWVQPWGTASAKAALDLPRNAATGRRYAGINVLILCGAVIEGGYPAQSWLTFRQALGLGGSVRKGERGTTVVYADRFVPDDEKQRATEAGGEARASPFLKRFTVFNAAQCDNLPEGIAAVAPPPSPGLIEPQVEALIRATKSTSASAATAPSTFRRRTTCARWSARYEEAARLKAAGMPLKRIAAAIGAERKTVRRWLRADGIPLWRQPHRPGLLARHVEYLNSRWNEGCHNAAQLWRELVALGFTGRPGIVRHWAGQKRKVEPQPSYVTAPSAEAKQPPTPRQISRLLMTDDALSAAEQTFVARLLNGIPGLADCITAAKRLNQLLRRKSHENLDAVLNAAAPTALKEFVVNLRRDQSAVQAALDSPWTTSPAEGQISRLKMLKRTMYGRAGFNLLRARVLHAA